MRSFYSPRYIFASIEKRLPHNPFLRLFVILLLLGVFVYLFPLLLGSYGIYTLWAKGKGKMRLVTVGILACITLLMSLIWLGALSESSSENVPAQQQGKTIATITPSLTHTPTSSPETMATDTINTPTLTILATNPGVPNGATALCMDGTYSFSQHRSGTCSHHDGVEEWF